MQGHISDFWSVVQTGSGSSPYDILKFRHEILPDDKENDLESNEYILVKIKPEMPVKSVSK